MPSLLILVPLAGLIILNLPFRDIMKRMAFPFAAALFLTQILLAVFLHSMLGTGSSGKTDILFNVNFCLDHLSFIILLSIGIVSLASLFVARCTSPGDKELFNFINLLIIASIGMSGIVMVNDIFSMYVFLEVTAVSAFIMIAITRGADALEGAFKYIMLSAVATVMMLAAIALLVMVSGDTSFASIREGLAGNKASLIARLSIGIFICGLFIKGGLVPFHGWLPDAYSAAPSYVSVLLAGIVTKVSGIYTLIRVVTSVFGIDHNVSGILMAVGAVSIIFGAVAAMGQNDFKRMLAYSSISQVGYIVLGLGVGTQLGLFGAIFHLFNHAIFKSLLFVNSAAVESRIGSKDMDRMGGLSYRMPVTGATSVIALLSTSGVPPLAGFWSKLIIIIALWGSGHYAYSAIAVLASTITLAYLLSMQRRVFFGKLRQGLENITEACPGFVVASIALAAITITVGLAFPFVFNEFIMAAKDILTR